MRKKISSTKIRYALFNTVPLTTGMILLIIAFVKFLLFLSKTNISGLSSIVIYSFILFLALIMSIFQAIHIESLFPIAWLPLRSDLYTQNEELVIGNESYKEKDIKKIELQLCHINHYKFYISVYILRVFIKQDKNEDAICYHFLSRYGLLNMIIFGLYLVFFKKHYQTSILNEFIDVLGDNIGSKLSISTVINFN